MAGRGGRVVQKVKSLLRCGKSCFWMCSVLVCFLLRAYDFVIISCDLEGWPCLEERARV
jgi:hypothetical protein